MFCGITKQSFTVYIKLTLADVTLTDKMKNSNQTKSKL